MIKVLWCRFQQCLGTFTMPIVEVSAETGLLTHLYDNSFGVPNIGNTKSVRVIFFFKIFKNKLDFKNTAKNRENALFLRSLNLNWYC